MPIKISATTERDTALSILDSNLQKISKVCKECYLSVGRGALLIYAIDVLNGRVPSQIDYRTKDELIDIFDNSDSRKRLNYMIDNYEPKNEGIMTLITSYSNATFFVTIKFK